MAWRNRHILLIGFKHTGKSTVGKHLALTLQRPFSDLDCEVERQYEKITGEKCNSREIVQREGEACFRALEEETLSKVINALPSVIALGGGTTLREANLEQIQGNTLIQMVVDRDLVFRRIFDSGCPAFIKQGEDIFESLNRLWNERTGIFAKQCDFSIRNSGSPSDTVRKIVKTLSERRHE